MNDGAERGAEGLWGGPAGAKLVELEEAQVASYPPELQPLARDVVRLRRSSWETLNSLIIRKIELTGFVPLNESADIADVEFPELRAAEERLKEALLDYRLLGIPMETLGEARNILNAEGDELMRLGSEFEACRKNGLEIGWLIACLEVAVNDPDSGQAGAEVERKLADARAAKARTDSEQDCLLALMKDTARTCEQRLETLRTGS